MTEPVIPEAQSSTLNAVATAARELALDYGCAGTELGDVVARAFERFADKLDGGLDSK